MKLYWFPGACSQAPHMIAREADIPIELVKVDTKEGKTESGEDYRDVNPLGLVPVLQLDDGTLLTESAVIVQYLADCRPEAGLIAKYGTMQRWQQMSRLNFIATEIHKTYRPIIKQGPEEAQRYARELFPPAFDVVSGWLAGNTWLTGASFGVVDAYFAVVFSWTRFIKYDTTRWPTLVDHLQRVRGRDKVRDALRAEGLLKS